MCIKAAHQGFTMCFRAAKSSLAMQILNPPEPLDVQTDIDTRMPRRLQAKFHSCTIDTSLCIW